MRPGDRHTYWGLRFTLDTARLGCTADEFAAAVSAEGVPAAGPYIGSGEEGPLYRNPFLAEPNCYGASRFPFDYGRERPVDYRLVECPNGEEIMGRGFGLPISPFHTQEDVDDIARAVRKVVAHYRQRG